MPRLQALRDLHDSKPQIDVVLRGCVPLVKLTPHTQRYDQSDSSRLRC